MSALIAKATNWWVMQRAVDVALALFAFLRGQDRLLRLQDR